MNDGRVKVTKNLVNFFPSTPPPQLPLRRR